MIRSMHVIKTARFMQNLFGCDQIGGPESLRKAIVYRLEVSDRVGKAALMRQ